MLFSVVVGFVMFRQNLNNGLFVKFVLLSVVVGFVMFRQNLNNGLFVKFVLLSVCGLCV